ncbi:C-type lectin domain family 4 member A-like isoform X2 [Narcine bancroftii]|uniref:C-type lectin domain family 4 member A-like isoform X2 n=1 Tax=Narcine bancroftii TaxID=1343680 RepID=UPI0038318A98
MRGTKGTAYPRARMEQDEEETEGPNEEIELPDLIMDVEDDVLEGESEDVSEEPIDPSQDRKETLYKALTLLGMLACLILLGLVIYFTVIYLEARRGLQTAQDGIRNSTEEFLRLRERIQQREQLYCSQFLNSTEHCLHLFCEKYECPSRICEPGWVLFRRNCYLFVNESQSWEESRKHCKEQGGHLAVVSSEKVQMFLANHSGGLPRWIGLTDLLTEGTWVWMDGTPVIDSSVFWARRQPDDPLAGSLDSGQDCGLLRGRRWFDEDCSRSFPSVCEAVAIRMHQVFQRARSSIDI